MANLPFETSQLTLDFTSTFELLLQQVVSKMRGLVDSKGYKGRAAAVVNQMAALQYRMPAGRYSPLQFQIAQFSRPWVIPTTRDLTVPVDNFDLLQSIADPKSVITQAAVAAANRAFDDVIISAAFGTTQRGEDTSSWVAETFPTTVSTTTSTSAPYGGFLVADTFGAGASVGMTYNKIREGRRVLEHYENDLSMTKVALATGSQQNSDMLGQVTVIDKRFNDKPVVESGNVTGILGCDIVSTERLQTSSSNTLRNTIMWVPGGLHLGIWEEPTTKIDNRIELTSQPWQLYSSFMIGACRTQLGKVLQINCADTTGADITP